MENQTNTTSMHQQHEDGHLHTTWYVSQKPKRNTASNSSANYEHPHPHKINPKNILKQETKKKPPPPKKKKEENSGGNSSPTDIPSICLSFCRFCTHALTPQPKNNNNNNIPHLSCQARNGNGAGGTPLIMLFCKSCIIIHQTPVARNSCIREREGAEVVGRLGSPYKNQTQWFENTILLCAFTFALALSELELERQLGWVWLGFGFGVR